MINLQDLSVPINQSESFSPLKHHYKLQPKDLVSIRVGSLDKNIDQLYNLDPVGINQVSTPSLFLNSYVISDSGYITLPIVGKINILNKTSEEAEMMIQKEIEKQIKNAVVILKLVNFKITVLGEVKNPGTFFFYNESATLFDALGLANDILESGNRETIKLFRTDENGTHAFNLDLTKKEILNSDYFNLLPNDVIYIAPLKAKAQRTAIPVANVALNALSTIILLITFIKKKN